MIEENSRGRLLENINNAQTILNDMICKAEKSGGYFQGLYSYRDLLEDLSKRINENKSLKYDNFLTKWDSIYGHAHRYFEAHPLLEILIEIDNVITIDLK